MRSLPGKVQATKAVEMAFEVPGRIIELPVKEGEEVKRGSLLAKLDPRDFQSSLAAAKATHEKAKADFERFQSLLEKEAVSQSQYERTKSNFEVAESDLERAQKALEDTELSAPFDGVVMKRLVDNYTNVQAKQPVLRFQDISWVEIIVDVPERIVAVAGQDSRNGIIAELDALPGREFAAELKEFSPEADPQTQTFKGTLLMPAPKDANVLPGMAATIRFKDPLVEAAENKGVVVPTEAVVASEKGKAYVWVIDEKTMTAHRRDVKAGRLTGDNVLINEGLNPGDRVVVAGAHNVREGMKVRLLQHMKRGH
jgi:RND family efflux transporter MFP subunit